jgi:glutathione S-transferase
LGSKECLFGVKLTVADFYLFNVLLWTKYVEINLADWPNLVSFVETLKKRPSVQKAFEEEGMKG